MVVLVVAVGLTARFGLLRDDDEHDEKADREEADEHTVTKSSLLLVVDILSLLFFNYKMIIF
jgi:hypothetical protein